MSLKEQGITEASFQYIANYVEEIKELISSDLWGNIFLDCSKNEILIFWLLYRKEEVNMTEIADYIHVPLNTATGIINRMEKNGLIIRKRSKEDKRVVLIRFSENGTTQFQALIEQMFSYGMKIMSAFSKEELDLFMRMTSKVKDVLRDEKRREESAPKVRKILIE